MSKPTAEEFVKDIEDAPGPGTPGIEEEKDTEEPTEHHVKLGHHVDKLEGLVGRIEELLSKGSEVVEENVADPDDSPIADKGPWTHRKLGM